MINLVSISGGKDSTATALLAIERSAENLRFVFCDTGLEAAVTYDYLDYLEQVLLEMTGVRLERIRADFSDRLHKKRENVIANGECHRAEALLPSGNPFLDLCLWKGRFPSSQARFCTQELKIAPTHHYIRELLNKGQNVCVWSGERAEESPVRAKKSVCEVLFECNSHEASIYRPILQWKEQECFEMLEKYGVKPNPLYAQGFSRVGCTPCMMCRKHELKRIAELYPEVIDQLSNWEMLVAQASKRQAATFFPMKANRNTLDDYVQWACTSRGGKQYQLDLEETRT